ncbi:MAG: cytochrome-c oxidase [Rhizobiales bacterium NRL2]|jgi:protein SCO1/2|nr:MAG: cytochrome-c oxidase [Rhizobiales bacterium NRL2]
MRSLLAILSVLTLAVFAAILMPAGAHSIKDKGELDRLMGDKEKYFQPLDKEAPDFTLLDANGNAVSRADLRGKVTVLHFIYAGCPDACPLHADRIAESQEMVNQTPMKDHVQFVTITTDPKNDTPDVLRDYGPAHGLDPVNWVFLTTRPEQPEDATRRLAEAHGHKFTTTEDGYQVHGVVTHIFDKRGRWRANFHGLKFEPTNLVTYINALTNESDAPPGHGHVEQSLWDRVMGLLSW